MSTLPLEHLDTATGPFDDIPEANPADLDIRRRAFKKPEQGCEMAPKAKRKKVDLNPTERRWLEREGYTFARVETANAWGGMVCDLWGFADYLACRPGEILLIQVTTDGHAPERERKARRAPQLRAWLAAGGRFQVHGWTQPGGIGTRWEIVIRETTLDNIDAAQRRKNARPLTSL